MDLKQIVSDILGTGLTQSRLAELVPCSQSLISAFVNGTRGARATYQIAARLKDLHSERVREIQGIGNSHIAPTQSAPSAIDRIASEASQ